MKIKAKRLTIFGIINLFFLVFLVPPAFSATITYQYDDAGRLIGADYGGGKTITYTYDKNGNLLQRKVQEGSTVEGDVDQNSVVDIVDALLTSMHYLGINVSGNFQVADLDGNGEIDMGDAIGIAEDALGF